VLLGTAAYMSPEQAKGRPADKRSDIWAFGCVFYEMLTGSRAFRGDDVADTLAAVLRGEPDYTLLPRDTPDAVRVLLRGCLTRDRHRRLSDVSAVRFVLEHVAVLGTSGAPVAPGPPRRAFTWRGAGYLAAAGVLLAAAAGATGWFVSRPSAPVVTTYEISPSGAAALFIDAVSRDLTVLPDGSVVYKAFGTRSSAAELYVRRRDRVEPELLMTGGSPRAPFSAPDGRQIGFVDVGAGLPQLKKMPLAGGPPILIAALDGPSAGVTWGEDDSIVFATSVSATGLQRVRSGEQTVEMLTAPDASRGEGDHLWPHYLPGARAVLFTITPAVGAKEQSDIGVLDLETKSHKRLNLRGATHPHYVSSGHLLYLVGATLYAVPFDLGRRAVNGTPAALPYQILTIPSGAAEFDVGRDGTLAYVPAGSVATAPRTLVWVDRDGRETPIGAPEHEYMQPRLSPDNSKLAVHVGDAEGDVYIWDFALRTLTPLTLEAGMQLAPVWMDDRHVAYASPVTGGASGTLMRRAVDGTGAAEELIRQRPVPAVLPNSVFGGTILASTLFTASDVLQVTLRDGSFRTWWKTEFFERNGEISPDGRWVAYEASNPAQTLAYNIYIRPLENPDTAQWPISINGGRQAAWRRDGRELFFVGPDGAIYGVEVEAGGATPNQRPPRKIVAQQYYHGIIGGAYAARMYDVTKDGQRFLMIKDAVPDRSAANASLRVRHHWTEELKRLVPSN
jgi:serine/threonine-protein kinase